MNKLLKPLKIGDTIGIVNPSFKNSKDVKEYQYMIDFLESRGYHVLLGKSYYAKCGYLAGPDELRASDINEMFRNKDVKAIICMRGGYGASRIIDRLDWDLIKENPKILAGYSDITVLVNNLYKIGGFPSFHGLTGSYLGDPEKDKLSIEDFFNKLTNNYKDKLLSYPGVELKALTEGIAEGVLVGGNLSLIDTLNGTPYEVDFTDKIVFIEDVGEDPYRIDRYFSALRLRGMLDKAKGYIIGYFTDCEPSGSHKDDQTIMDILNDYLVPLNKPIIYNFPCGHDMPFVTLPIGVKVKMDTYKKEIKVLEDIYETSSR